MYALFDLGFLPMEKDVKKFLTSSTEALNKFETAFEQLNVKYPKAANLEWVAIFMLIDNIKLKPYDVIAKEFYDKIMKMEGTPSMNDARDLLQKIHLRHANEQQAKPDAKSNGGKTDVVHRWDDDIARNNPHDEFYNHSKMWINNVMDNTELLEGTCDVSNEIFDDLKRWEKAELIQTRLIHHENRIEAQLEEQSNMIQSLSAEKKVLTIKLEQIERIVVDTTKDQSSSSGVATRARSKDCTEKVEKLAALLKDDVPKKFDKRKLNSDFIYKDDENALIWVEGTQEFAERSK